VLFALKDTVGLLLYIALLAGSVVIGRPFLRPLFAQAVGAMTPEQRHALDPVLDEKGVARGMVRGTLAVALATLLAAIVNVILNVRIVTAPFGTESFNQQVAQVNAITRIAFPLVTAGALGLALWGIYRAVFAQLPLPPGVAWHEADIWALLRQREQQQHTHEHSD
jgi:hypothetical protein